MYSKQIEQQVLVGIIVTVFYNDIAKKASRYHERATYAIHIFFQNTVKGALIPQELRSQ